MDNLSGGFVKIYRSLLNWEWYTDINTKSLFIHCLLKVNHKDNNYRGTLIKAGSFATSYDDLAREIGLTQRKVRTALNKLKKTNELTVQTTNKGTIITVLKWEDYQDIVLVTDKQNDKQLDNRKTNKRQTSDKQTTTNNNDKNDNNEKNDNNINTYVEQNDSEMVEEIFNESVKEKYDIKSVIDYLNDKAEKKFGNVNSNAEHIRARYKEGYTFDDFKKVIDLKVSQWKGNTWKNKSGKTVVGDDYLRPSTLFSPKNFQNYLNEKPKSNQDEIKLKLKQY